MFVVRVPPKLQVTQKVDAKSTRLSVESNIDLLVRISDSGQRTEGIESKSKLQSHVNRGRRTTFVIDSTDESKTGLLVLTFIPLD